MSSSRRAQISSDRVHWTNNICIIGKCAYRAMDDNDLLRHFSSIHRKDGDFKIQCLYNKNCLAGHEFTSFSGIYKHLKQCHNDFFGTRSDTVSDRANQFSEFSHEEEITVPCASLDPPQGQESEIQVEDTVRHTVTQSSHADAGARFLLKLKADKKMSQLTAQYVMEETKALVRAAVLETIQRCSNIYAENGQGGSDLLAGLYSQQENYDPFAGLEHQRNQVRHFVNHFGMIQPEKIEIPGSQEEDGGPHSFFKVPIVGVIERLLQFDDVYEEWNNCSDRVPGVYSSYKDGEAFKSSLFFDKHPDGLHIHLYLDDVQPCNEKGSRTENNKLLFIYFTLGNLGRKFRTTYRSIYLVAICYHWQVVKYTLNVILRPIIDEIRLLEFGRELRIKGQTRTVYGTLGAIVADNLASHQIGGLMCAFANGFRRCKTCLGTDWEIQNKYFHCLFVLRNRDDHDRHCALLASSAIRDHISQVYGIKYDSVVNYLDGFHVIFGLLPDPMHDLLEGVLPRTICELLSYCTSNKFFSLDLLNEIIANFKYGPHEAVDKPSVILKYHLKNKKLRQSAAQTWMLGTKLPLMIGHLVPRDDLRWLCFITLLRFCRIAFSDTVSECETVSSDLLAAEYLQLFQQCFGDGKGITVKMHNMIHYGHYIRLYGPLTQFSCMRYESKHRYFKQVQRNLNNFINMPYSLSVRHQEWQCNEFMRAENKLFDMPIKFSESKCVPLIDYICSNEIGAFFNLENLNYSIEEFTFIKIGTNQFKSGLSVVMCPDDEFGLIKKIVGYDKKPLFICEMLQVDGFDDHFQAFRLRSKRNVSTETSCLYALVPPSALVDYRVFAYQHAETESPEIYFVSSKTNTLNMTL